MSGAALTNADPARRAPSIELSVAPTRSTRPLATPGLGFFLRHELRLAWREALGAVTGGKPRRTRWIAVLVVAFVALMHLIATAVVAPLARIEPGGDRGTLVVVTGCILLAWSLMLSQAMESVTRAFYARADLDLILSSPAPPRRAFAVRIAILAGSTILMALLLAAPFINVLVWRGGARWLSAYVTVVAVGAIAAAMAIALTVTLFRLIGPARTRLIAQFVAAIIGAMFVIGLQVGAVITYGSMSQLTFLQSPWIVAMVPPVDHFAWWPARALLGDKRALLAILVTGAIALGVAIAAVSARFAEDTSAAAGVAERRPQRRSSHGAAAHRSPQSALRHKEWRLLRRDPWLVSQTLTQLLYLLPAALMLWSAFGQTSGDLVLLVPVLVMAAGQLAGGLAWLAISGEDAPELVATAPVTPRVVIRAKIEAVGLAVGVIFAPFVAIMAIASPRDGWAAGAGVLCAAMAAALIQIWFRQQGERRRFNRRHTASRVATFAEAFSSIAWAATAGLAAAGHWQAGIAAMLALIVLGCARLARPPQR